MTPGLKLGLGAVAVLFLTVALMRPCGVMEPIVIPDWADSVRAVRVEAQYERLRWRDSVARVRAESDSIKRVADSWRQRALVRPARPPRPGTIPPDSGSHPDTNPDTMSGYRAQVDSLWAALDASDSAYASLESAFTAQKQATADAMAWKDLEAERADSTGAVADAAITDLTARLRKAQRGCRVLGLLPCPQLALTGGVTTLGGAIGMGATLGVSIPIKLGGS